MENRSYIWLETSLNKNELPGNLKTLET